MIQEPINADQVFGAVARQPVLFRLLQLAAADPRATICLAYLVLLLLASLAAPLILPYSPYTQNIANALLDPSWAHPLGTDDLGRDVLTRLIYGARVSLYASFLAVGLACAIGIPVGLFAGFMGGYIDDAISRLIDTLLSFPAIVLAIGVTGALGAGLTNAMIAIGIVYSPMLARLARSQTLVVRRELYVDAARNLGASNWRMLTRHILPNAIQPLIVQATLLLAAALLAEAGLSFLGLGVQLPEPSWGTMLARGYTYMETAPQQTYAPGFAIMLTALAFNGLGESARNIFDPLMKFD